MKSTKHFNNISDELKKEIPKLKPGQVVTFQMLNGVPNPEPDEKERSKSPILYGKVQIQTNFRIYDPHKEDYVDVGCVDYWNGDRPEKFRFFVPGMGEYTQFGGKFSLMGGNIRDEELYEILYLSHEREGNPHRDTSVKPLFKILDQKADSKTSFNKVAQLRKALEAAEKISEKDARKVMAALNQPNYADKEILMAKIGELARDKYELFLQTIDDPQTALKSDIKEALDADVLKFDLASGQVSMGDVKITNLNIKSTDSFIAEMAKWVESAENGKDVMSNVRKQLKKVTA